MANKVYLIDGSGYIFRAYYAVAPLTNRQGFPTNALYGFLRMLIKLLGQADSQHVIMVFDAGRETFRNKIYSEYKANRSECPEDLVPQMPYFRSISEALGLPILELPGYEADDVIGTLTERFAAAKLETVIITGDKDLMQLIGPHVGIWDTLKDRRIGRAEVIEKFGVPPEKVVEILALIGDSSDNIPGLKGVGPKTATQLIEKFGDVEGILAAKEAILNDATLRNRKKIAEQIESDREIVRLSRTLALIDRQAPVTIKLRAAEGESESGKIVAISELNHDQLLEATLRCAPNQEGLLALFEKFEFDQSLLKNVITYTPKAVEADPAYTYKTIYRDEFDAWIAAFAAEREWAFDLETSSLDPFEAAIIGVSFCCSDDTAYYIPLGHRVEAAERTQVTLDEFRAASAKLFTDASIKKCGQNLKFDISILEQNGFVVEGVDFDTMIASYVLNPDKSSHNLTVLANEHLGKSVIEYDEVLGEHEEFAAIPVKDATRYACQDAHFVWLLKAKLAPLLEARELTRVFQEIEMPLVRVLSRMERRGVKLNLDLLAQMSGEFAGQLAELQKQVFDLCGGEFNLNSPKQLGVILFEKLGISTRGLKKTKTGISTDSSVLEKLSSQHPVPALILRYRTVHKLKSTYVDALPSQVSKVTGRLHSRFNQTVTGTGRLSSSDPNLQNIPVQTAEGRRIRAAFVPCDGSLLISADYSQIELRVLAHMSGDPNLIQAFVDGADIHARTAREILGLGAEASVSSEQRRVGKTINFGIVYGMGAFRLSRELGISMDQATRYIESYFDKFSQVREFFARLEHDALKQGFVATMFGRKRIIADIDTSGRDQGFVIRAAMNAPIQGSAADIIKLAMISLEQRVAREKLDMRLLMQIHDELVFESPRGGIEHLLPLVQGEMERVVQLKVPLKVDARAGTDWEQAHA